MRLIDAALPTATKIVLAIHGADGVTEFEILSKAETEALANMARAEAFIEKMKAKI
jgi:hypothetical protein